TATKPNTKPLITHIGGRGANTIAPITNATASAPHPTAPSSLQLWKISSICNSSRSVHRHLEDSPPPEAAVRFDSNPFDLTEAEDAVDLPHASALAHHGRRPCRRHVRC